MCDGGLYPLQCGRAQSLSPGQGLVRVSSLGMLIGPVSAGAAPPQRSEGWRTTRCRTSRLCRRRCRHSEGKAASPAALQVSVRVRPTQVLHRGHDAPGFPEPPPLTRLPMSSDSSEKGPVVAYVEPTQRHTIG